MGSSRMAIVLLVLAGICLALAPLLMPPEYRSISHSISESAAQGIRGAWLARLGLLLFGIAALWLALALHARWSRATVISFGAFAAMLFASAAFSHRPWMPGVAFDPIEDILHSVAANGVGMGFVAGLVSRAIQCRANTGRWRGLDLLVLLASIGAPIALAAEANFGGLAQRLMFGIAIVWLIREAAAQPSPRRARDARPGDRTAENRARR